MKQFSDTLGWYKSTYFLKIKKRLLCLWFPYQWNTIMVAIQVNILMDENITMLVIQVSILLDDAIQWYPWVIQVNILFKNRKTHLCRWFKSAYFWMTQFSDTHGWYKSTYFSKSRKLYFIDDSSERNLRVWQFRVMLFRRRVTHSSADEH